MIFCGVVVGGVPVDEVVAEIDDVGFPQLAKRRIVARHKI